MTYGSWLPILIVATFLPSTALVFLLWPKEYQFRKMMRSGSGLALAFAIDSGRRLYTIVTGPYSNFSFHNTVETVIIVGIQLFVIFLLWARFAVEVGDRMIHRDLPNRFPKGGDT